MCFQGPNHPILPCLWSRQDTADLAMLGIGTVTLQDLLKSTRRPPPSSSVPPPPSQIPVLVCLLGRDPCGFLLPQASHLEQLPWPLCSDTPQKEHYGGDRTLPSQLEWLWEQLSLPFTGGSGIHPAVACEEASTLQRGHCSACFQPALPAQYPHPPQGNGGLRAGWLGPGQA